MRNKCVQLSLFDTYNDVCSAMEGNKSEFIQLLEEHINFESFIPDKFRIAFYKAEGRPRETIIESYLKYFVVQDVLGIERDTTMLSILKLSPDLLGYLEFDTVPAASQITRFKQDFVECLDILFKNMVEITEPICRRIDPKKADELIYDTTGIEANVAENNPKFISTRITNAKKFASKNPGINPHSLAYSQLPETAAANPFVKQQYINGHFCYAHKAGILTNGLGIVRHISFFDDCFKRRHPDIVEAKSDNPALDKEIGDSSSLIPVLTDFFGAHPSFSCKTFIGDSAFDKYDTYKALRRDFHFERMVIPLNNRNSKNSHSDFDSNGTPLCPIDATPFTFVGQSGGKKRSKRFKWVCHKSEKVPKTSNRICTCETPCTNSSYGRCVYTYPDKNLRLYPGIARGTDHWDNLYRHRVVIERTNWLLKEPLGGVKKTYSTRTAKANLLLAGITQLVGVLLADAIHEPKLIKSIRKLIA